MFPFSIWFNCTFEDLGTSALCQLMRINWSTLKGATAWVSKHSIDWTHSSPLFPGGSRIYAGPNMLSFRRLSMNCQTFLANLNSSSPILHVSTWKTETYYHQEPCNLGSFSMLFQSVSKYLHLYNSVLQATRLHFAQVTNHRPPTMRSILRNVAVTLPATWDMWGDWEVR